MAGLAGGAISGGTEVAFVAGESYAADLRGHLVLTDQAAGYGGDDVAPSPTELLVAAIASGVAFYAGRYLSRHGVSRDKLRVHAEYAVAGHPARAAICGSRCHSRPACRSTGSRVSAR
jgi:hypothetical protein